MCLDLTITLTALSTLGILLAAIYAARSAKMSEIANRPSFSPIIIPKKVTFISAGSYQENGEDNLDYFSIRIENRSEYKNAYAKDIRLRLNAEVCWEINTLQPESEILFEKRSIDSIDVLSKTITITYKDIFNNKFRTIVRLDDKITKETPIHDSANILFDWKYIN